MTASQMIQAVVRTVSNLIYESRLIVFLMGLSLGLSVVWPFCRGRVRHANIKASNATRRASDLEDESRQMKADLEKLRQRAAQLETQLENSFPKKIVRDHKGTQQIYEARNDSYVHALCGTTVERYNTGKHNEKCPAPELVALRNQNSHETLVSSH